MDLSDAQRAKEKQRPTKHHFVPVFYTKRWAGADRRLCEYSRPFDVVRPKRRHPDATGYEVGLYSLRHLPAEQQQAVEEGFLRRTDQDASDALDWMLGPHAREPMSTRLRTGWSRFLMSMMQRSPARLDWMVDEVMKLVPASLGSLRERYKQIRQPGDPPFEEIAEEILSENNRSYYSSRRALFMRKASDLKGVGYHLNNMEWDIFHFNDSIQWSLLTSDRPVVMSNGLKYDQSFALMALGPKTMFVAANNRRAMGEITRNAEGKEFIRVINRQIVTQAERLVYGVDDTQLRFVENHLRKRDNPPAYRSHS